LSWIYIISGNLRNIVDGCSLLGGRNRKGKDKKARK
jgi:hypothetical protein